MLDEDKTFVRCPYCKDEIVLEDDDVLYFGHSENTKTFWHQDCLIKKETSKKVRGISHDEVDDFIQRLRYETNNQRAFYINRRKLFDWIHNHYHQVSLPQHFKRKMDNVFKGFYDGLTRPVPPEHVLDMWKRKAKELNNIKMRNVKKGFKLEGLRLIQYDLAVILSKYDSYLDWQRQLQAHKSRKREPVEMLTKGLIDPRKRDKTPEEIAKEEHEQMLKDMIDQLYEEGNDRD